MRKRIWIPCTVVIAICLLLLLHKAAGPGAVPPEQSEVVTNQPNPPEPPKAVKNRAVTNVPRNALTLPANATPLAQAIAQTSPVAAQRLVAWQTPIEFYGKAVDENSNAVAGAQVVFSWVEMPTSDGNRTTNTVTDAEGLFSLHGERGPDLEIAVSKEGYYPRRSWARYGPFGNPNFTPDPQNPIIFQLRKKGQGAELITSEKGYRPDLAIRIPKDNTPVRVDFFQKQANPTGQLEISQNKPPRQEAAEWSFKMTIPDGGFVENQDEFQFEAPETNYQPSIENHFVKSETNWTTHVTKSYYITFGQPRKYGWLRIESDLDQETVFITYAINPTGSRNLEPAK
jgi:hypothetical protein